jgi:hypothetical protein
VDASDSGHGYDADKPPHQHRRPKGAAYEHESEDAAFANSAARGEMAYSYTEYGSDESCYDGYGYDGYGYSAYSSDESESSGYASDSVGPYESSGYKYTHSGPEDDPSPSLVDGSPASAGRPDQAEPSPLAGAVSIEAHSFTREYVRPPEPPRPVNLVLARFTEMEARPSDAIESAALAAPAFTFSGADEGRLKHLHTRDGPLVRPIAEIYRRFLESENSRLEPGGLTAPRRPVMTGANPRGSRLLAPMANTSFGEAPPGQVTVRFL